MRTPGTILHCLTTGRRYTVITKRKPKSGYLGDGVKVIHLDGGHIKMSVREDLVTKFFEEIDNHGNNSD